MVTGTRPATPATAAATAMTLLCALAAAGCGGRGTGGITTLLMFGGLAMLGLVAYIFSKAAHRDEENQEDDGSAGYAATPILFDNTGHDTDTGGGWGDDSGSDGGGDSSGDGGGDGGGGGD